MNCLCTLLYIAKNVVRGKRKQRMRMSWGERVSMMMRGGKREVESESEVWEKVSLMERGDVCEKYCKT